jgi:hypothetical protein
MGNYDCFGSLRVLDFLDFISLCGCFNNWHAECCSKDARITPGKKNNTTK